MRKPFEAKDLHMILIAAKILADTSAVHSLYITATVDCKVDIHVARDEFVAILAQTGQVCTVRAAGSPPHWAASIMIDGIRLSCHLLTNELHLIGYTVPEYVPTNPEPVRIA